MRLGADSTLPGDGPHAADVTVRPVPCISQVQVDCAPVLGTALANDGRRAVNRRYGGFPVVDPARLGDVLHDSLAATDTARQSLASLSGTSGWSRYSDESRDRSAEIDLMWAAERVIPVRCLRDAERVVDRGGKVLGCLHVCRGIGALTV